MTPQQADQIAAELFAEPEGGMKWQAVDSSQISEIGYESGVEYPLGIRFPAGKRSPASEYHYKNVSPEMHAEFLRAESIGSFFGKNIKSRPDLYPYVKVETENPTPPVPRSTKSSGNGNTESIEETTIDAPSTALAVIDMMADELLFTPGAVTDAQLEAGRQWYLAEAQKYHDISTEKARTELKRFARPLQKLRTGIEARAKELTGATKRKIAAIDAEKRRLVQIVGGIEDEVLSPLAAWEQEEESRKVRLSNTVVELAAKGGRFYTSTEEIEAAIAELESFDISGMQEYKLGAESAIAASLKVLKPELERRKKAAELETELSKLRAEAAARAEQDRLEAVARQARESAQREAAVEAERQRAAAKAAEEYAAMEARAADEAHREHVHREIVEALKGYIRSTVEAEAIVTDIAKGLIPHLTINY